ncbi:MAG: alpha-L-fucosidase [Lentisphaerae bacterium]|nr:alpha-L-fucosidase [Lentisphaerota bacterium]
MKQFDPVPTPRQLVWHKLKFYGFIHFTVNTFTDLEWGYGDEPESIFNPTELDCRQWARVASEAGMRGLILTAKHHDGFCLWPSPYTEHSVKNSPWKNGKGNVVREFVDACREYDLEAGFYLSPWDRNHAEYGSPAYVEYYRKQLLELLTGYGPLFEFWFDGANGGDGYYGGARETRKIDATRYYDFPELWDLVRTHQPGTCMFSDAGPDIRWCGNEAGVMPLTSWAKIHGEGFAPGRVDAADGQTRLGTGDPDGEFWRGVEVDISMRPGWFWHESEPPRSLEELKAVYHSSIERGGNLLLNLAPDNRGLIPDADIERLREFSAFMKECESGDVAHEMEVEADSTAGTDWAATNLVDGSEETAWAAEEGVHKARITLAFPEGKGRRINAVRLEEFIELGQRVESFKISVCSAWGQEIEMYRGSTVGPLTVARFPNVHAEAVHIDLTARAAPVLRRVGVHVVK